jgi:polyphosphate kinase
MRPRNLRHRVELLVPVSDSRHHAQLDQILELYLNDPTAWDLKSSGEYVQRKGSGEGAQETFIDQAQASEKSN